VIEDIVNSHTHANIVFIDSLEKAKLLKQLLDEYITSVESGDWDFVYTDTYEELGDDLCK
jgi:hypothetical protein